MENNNDKIEIKRTESFVAVFLLLVKLGYIDGLKFTLNRSILKSVVKYYIQDLAAMKARYGIDNFGFKPVLPKNGSDETLFESEENEILAIFHGLCMCAENNDGKVDSLALKNLYTKPEFPEWVSNLRYILKFRGYTAESLAMVFDTLVRFAK